MESLVEYLQDALEESDLWSSRRRANRRALDKIYELRSAGREATDWNELNTIRNSIDGTGSGWSTPTWQFVRMAKGHPELIGLSADEAMAKVEEVLGPEVLWSHFPDSEDPQVEFLATWDKIRTPGKGDILDHCLEEARRLPLRPLLRRSKSYCEFLSLAGHLQRCFPGEPIALPVERIGELLDLSYQTVCNYRNLAAADRLIYLVQKHIPRQKAATYIFAEHCFDWRTGQQIQIGSDTSTTNASSTSEMLQQSNTEGTGLIRIGGRLGALFAHSGSPTPARMRIGSSKKEAGGPSGEQWNARRQLLLNQAAVLKKQGHE